MDLWGHFLWLRKSNRKQQASTKPHVFCITFVVTVDQTDFIWRQACVGGECPEPLWQLDDFVRSFCSVRNVEVLCPISVILNWQETCSVDQGALFLCCVQVPLTRASAFVFGIVSAIAAGSSWLMCHTRLLFIICLYWRSIHSGTWLLELHIFSWALLILALVRCYFISFLIFHVLCLWWVDSHW